MGVILILTGTGVYYYVGKLTTAQYVFPIRAGNFIVSQVKMLCDFAKALGIIFALVGVAATAFALDRLSLAKSTHKRAA